MATSFERVSCAPYAPHMSELRVDGRLIGYSTFAISPIPEVGAYSVFLDSNGKRIPRLDGFGIEDAVHNLRAA